MTPDYEFDLSVACPECGHEPTHWRRCTNAGCNDGYIDLFDGDPLWHDLTSTAVCEECNGAGVERWCPSCGCDLNKRGLEASL